MYWVGFPLSPQCVKSSNWTGMGWVRPNSHQCLDNELSVPHDGHPGHGDGRLLLRLDHRPCLLPRLQPPHHSHQFQPDQACHCRCFCCLLCPPCFPHGDCSLWLWLQHEGLSLSIIMKAPCPSIIVSVKVNVASGGLNCISWLAWFFLHRWVTSNSWCSKDLMELVTIQDGWSAHNLRSRSCTSSGLQCCSWASWFSSNLLDPGFPCHLAFCYCASPTSLVCVVNQGYLLVKDSTQVPFCCSRRSVTWETKAKRRETGVAILLWALKNWKTT